MAVRVVKVLAQTWTCKHCFNANNTNLRTCLRCARQQGVTLPGFVVEGMGARELVVHLSARGELHDVLSAACELYGLELVVTDAANSKLQLQVTK